MNEIKNTNLIPPSPEIDIQNLKPFTKFCCSIGAIPTSYLVSWSYEEQLLWLCDFLENTVIPTVNNNGEAVAELQSLFIQLKDYVDNYFKNLDVQEEINNKLDQMVQDGTLENILLNYTSQIKIYNTYNDLISDKNNLQNNQKLQTLGYYNINDGGESLYYVTNIQDNNNYQIDLENGLFLTLILNNNTLNIKQVGCVGDGETDDTENLQKAFNICCDYNLVLFVPKNNFYISNSINIKSSINVKGESNSSYKVGSEITVNIGDENIEVFTSTDRTPRCTFENIKIQRKRTNNDGYPANVYAYGKSGICFGIDSNETVFNRCCVIGFGSVFNQTQITTCQECDFIYCNNIINSNNIVSAVNFMNCNMYVNGLLFDINSSIQNLNITDCWIEDFTSLLKNYHKPIQNFNITNSVLTNTNKGENYLIYDNSENFSRQFFNIINSVLYIKKNICDGAPSNTEMEMRILNSTIFYGGTGETINIVGNSKFMNLNSQNITSLNTRGFDFSNNIAYNPITFKQNSELPTKKEATMYYNNVNNAKRFEFFNNSDYRNIIPPIIINPNSDGSKPNFTPTSLTFSINQLLFNGDTLGWVFHPTTNNWVALPQIGYLEYTGSPINNIVPKRIGVTLFDTINKNWYISTGTTNQDWKLITN